jgi:hypothetical protein
MTAAHAGLVGRTRRVTPRSRRMYKDLRGINECLRPVFDAGGPSAIRLMDVRSLDLENFLFVA